MYTEQFKFTFIEKITDSERMGLLSEMFSLAEEHDIDRINFCGYTINQNGTVKFSSSLPNLTTVVVDWLKQNNHKITVAKPSYAQENA